MKLDGTVRRIEELKQKRQALILAHVYQRKEVQDVADFTGDSLALSKAAVDTDAKVIVFCGVRFMAETAAMLNPDKVVLLPRKEAGCPLADMARVEDVRAKRKEYPNSVVVSYVNSSASVKAVSDVCCTSSNAVDVVNSLSNRTVLFLPDKNLGRFVASKVDKRVIFWDGFCYVHHENIRPEDIRRVITEYPQAEVIVHPECRPEVIDLADFVGSTRQMAEYVGRSKSREFIVGTENGILHSLRKENPNKRFYSLSPLVVCRDMKLTQLKDVASALENMQFQIRVPEKVTVMAEKALTGMLEPRKGHLAIR
ncbi:quinolinate synthase NadA [Candidatus Aerophobetes bacterium]|uniref:Quinolinate synthase n=1 Tax=Aerophobetes bacterium TaxID=2030807 RepID=A0A523W2R7_UNCAE|nr:MAG: quinolinate synthase NadA [Candidatus Aerophobetes bacterium]